MNNMNLCVLAAVMLLFLSSCTEKQNSNNAGSVKKTPVAETQKSSEFEFDFGKLKEGERPKHVFQYTNKTAKPIKILNSRVPCGCAKVSVTERILQPGESFEFSVRFDSRKSSGKISKVFYIMTDSKDKPLIEYMMKADVIPEPAPVCVVTPPFTELGNVKAGETRSSSFTVCNKGQLELIITDITADKSFAVSTKVPIKIKPGGQKKVEFSYTIPSKAVKGRMFDKLVLATNDPKRRNMFFIIRGIVQ